MIAVKITSGIKKEMIIGKKSTIFAPLVLKIISSLSDCSLENVIKTARKADKESVVPIELNVENRMSGSTMFGDVAPEAALPRSLTSAIVSTIVNNAQKISPA